MPLTNIVLSPEIKALQVGENAASAAPGFSEQFSKFLSGINDQMQKAEESSAAFASGESNNIHEAVLTAEQAVISFKLVGTIRQRMVEVYQEVMRTNM
ncbi:MAG: flagellar hook-basal body complex protein FliE [Proteobacteria bacterium]|nr:flagellar hook-basal body complex protein FliE [Pseudomonadota bacterium]